MKKGLSGFRLLFTELILVFIFSHKALCLYDSSSDVKLLTAQDFQQKVKHGSDVWLVEFFAPWCGHCKNFAPEYIKVAKALKGIVKVGAVDDKSIFTTEDVPGLPHIKLFLGHESGVAKVYKNARSAPELLKFVLKELSSLTERRLLGSTSSTTHKSKKSTPSSLVELTDGDFRSKVINDKDHIWFVMFYAPWCGHCKALKGTWLRLAQGAKKPLKVGRLDATVHTNIATLMKIQGFPTLVIFPAGKKSFDNGIPYQGERDLSSLQNFASSFIAQTRSVEQLLSQKQFSEECERQLCILAFLPHYLDSKESGRKMYLEEYNKVLRSMPNAPIHFLWLQGGDNLEVEEALQLQFGYPAMIAIHLQKKKFAIHKGNFNIESMRMFLSGLMTGRQPLNNLPSSLPPFSKMDKWILKESSETSTKPSTKPPRKTEMDEL